MPTPLMKSFAKDAHRKTKTVEKLWKKAEKVVKGKYEIDKDSNRYYPLVVGVLKHFLGLSKDEVNEDGGITTGNMGDYAFASKLGSPAARPLDYGKLLPVDNEITNLNKSKKYSNKQYDKLIRDIVYNANAMGLGEDFDEMLSDTIKYYCENETDVDDVVDKSLDAIGKYFNVIPTIFDEMN